jgi:hypothetical protein
MPPLHSLATPVGFPPEVRSHSPDRAYVKRTSSQVLERLRKASPDGVVRILALSGGGAGGAFGAGALVGLSRRGERPQYDVVTGVSAGALIAPFAFLGSQWDAQLSEAFSGVRAEHLLGLGRLQEYIDLLLHHGMARSTGLTSLVDQFVTADLVQAVAREAASGRMLLVITTDLDQQDAVVWDLGRIAACGGEPARKLFRDVLVASASVPGLFSPVLIRVEQGGKIYEEMHVDGNTTTSLFVVPEVAYFMPFEPAMLQDSQLYVLMNGQMTSAPSTTAFRLGSILAHSFSAALTHLSRAQIAAVQQFADRYDLSLRLTWIPADVPKAGSFEFRSAQMRRLFDYGARCAENGHLWATVSEAEAREVAAQRGLLQSQPECPVETSGPG